MKRMIIVWLAWCMLLTIATTASADEIIHVRWDIKDLEVNANFSATELRLDFETGPTGFLQAHGAVWGAGSLVKLVWGTAWLNEFTGSLWIRVTDGFFVFRAILKSPEFVGTLTAINSDNVIVDEGTLGPPTIM